MISLALKSVHGELKKSILFGFIFLTSNADKYVFPVPALSKGDE